MKILLAHNYYGSSAPSGENKVFEAERAMLEKHGHEVCVYTRSVRNEIECEGVLEMDYTVEIRGAQAERTKFLLRVLPSFDQPKKANG